jgi:hypothetical protein
LYRAFGLCIASEVSLIELPPGSGEPDVEVSFGTVDGVSESSNDWTVIAAPGEVRGWIPDAGAFLVRGGREMIIDPAPNADDRALRLGIVGPLLGVILTQRGRFVLHASTVAIDGRAVSFCGPSGRGKSTLTAAMTRAGHVLVADDLTLIDAEHDPPIVQPGFARIKLWPDSATALEEDVAALPLIHPQREKRSLQLDRVESDALPIARCYLLEDGDAESVAEPNPREAILALIATTYQSQWLHETGAASANLAQCAALVRSGRVWRLRRRRDFAVLDEVVRFIENDVRALG